MVRAAGDPVTYAVSGAGSDVRMGDFGISAKTEVQQAQLGLRPQYLAEDQGFMAVTVGPERLRLHVFTATGGTQVCMVTSCVA